MSPTAAPETMCAAGRFSHSLRSTMGASWGTVGEASRPGHLQSRRGEFNRDTLVVQPMPALETRLTAVLGRTTLSCTRISLTSQSTKTQTKTKTKRHRTKEWLLSIAIGTVALRVDGRATW